MRIDSISVYKRNYFSKNKCCLNANCKSFKNKTIFKTKFGRLDAISIQNAYLLNIDK